MANNNTRNKINYVKLFESLIESKYSYYNINKTQLKKNS